MHRDGISFEEALRKVKSCRPCIEPNEGDTNKVSNLTKEIRK